MMSMRSRLDWKRAAAGAALMLSLLAPFGARGQVPSSNDLGRAERARDAIFELDVAGAKTILEGADPADSALALERARLAIYAQECDEAVAILARPDLAGTNEGAELGEIARGCARATAATVVTMDKERGVEVRLQDDEDGSLVPLLVDVAARARELLAKELGVTLPTPIHIVLVRDQLTLSAMTGLPEEAARTTGTVAVAKWGRVTMISPRATRDGYVWQDTLVHELTHLALTAGSRDRAPLWLQEGVAKREEVRWRPVEPLDDVPPIDAVAAIGMDKGLGRSIDKLGPSIAMLPTPEQAQVAFAEVSSFIRFWMKEAGDEALPQLLLRLKAAQSSDAVGKAIEDVSGVDFATWDKRWRAHLAATPRDLPPHLVPGGSVPNLREIGRRLRLGELLAARHHDQAAAIELARGQSMAPFDASLRCYLAATLLAQGYRDNAAALVEKVEDIHGGYGRWWSLHGLLTHGDDAETSFTRGVAIDPLDPNVACEEKSSPDLPKDPVRAAICEMARRAPR
jgi:hypothetical protein